MKSMKHSCRIIGVNSPVLSESQKKLLGSCALIVGGKRLLKLCAGINTTTFSITPLDPAIDTIREILLTADVAVLASGDPLFFGIGKRLIAELGSESVLLYPALSSMQVACARFKIPWDDAEIVSLHGRSSCHIPGMVMNQAKTFVFTDQINTPEKIAMQIIDYLHTIGEYSLLETYTVMVAEDLGDENEKVFSGTLQEVSAASFSALNVMCLLRPKAERLSVFGVREDDVQHSRGLITKDEVRAVTLHRLQLPVKGVLWDVGAGSGSVSIEAARMNPSLTVYAVEKKAEELENIRANIRKYGCYNVVPVVGRALDVLTTLPDPNRVFIGGNGGQLQGIIEEAARRMPVGGSVVVNGVIEKTVTLAPQCMKACGLQVQMSTIHFTRTDEAGKQTAFNPITIIAGGKIV